MEAKKNSLGQKIKRFRLINDIRQEDMADKLGISRATLINYEKGHTTINFEVLGNLKTSYPNFNEVDAPGEKPKIIENNIIDFKLLFKVLNGSRNKIILFTLACFLSGLLVSFAFTKYYTAQISLYPAKNDQTRGLSQFQSLAANFGLNTNQDSEHFNISDVVKSRLIANKVLNHKWVDVNDRNINLVEFWGYYKQPWFDLNSNYTIDTLVVLESALNKFKKHISVIEDRVTGLIKIDSRFEDPFLSAEIANLIGDEVQNYIQKENSAQSTKEKLFILERLKIVKNELELIEGDLKIFKERNRGYENSPELFMVFSRLFRESESKKEVYMTLQKQLELARIEEVKQKPILHILDHAVPPTRKSSPNRFFFMLSFGVIGLISSSLRILFIY